MDSIAELVFLFIFSSLAAYRLSRMSTSDTITDWFRNYLFDKKSQVNGRQWYWAKTYQLFVCDWCIGFWISGATTLILDNFQSIPYPLFWWLATSTVVGLLGELVPE